MIEASRRRSGMAYSQWVVLTSYSSLDCTYVVHARKNLRTGMIQFKTKRINPFFVPDCPTIPVDIGVRFAIVEQGGSI
jgi:hypothetical protein